MKTRQARAQEQFDSAWSAELAATFGRWTAWPELRRLKLARRNAELVLRQATYQANRRGPEDLIKFLRSHIEDARRELRAL